MEYVEHAPLPALAGAVRTVWIQSTGDTAHVQRHLPTGGVEMHVPIGGDARLLGPLTGPVVDVIPPRTTVVGVRFHPGAAPSVPAALGELVDRHLRLTDLRCTGGLEDEVAAAGSPQGALDVLQQHVLHWMRESRPPDPRLVEVIGLLMPWHPVEVTSVADYVGLSMSQLRRRCIHVVGVGPKVLQRTLRFQGFLALAQAGAVASGRRGVDGVAGVAADVGYADQAHLSRECRRLAGLTPTALLGGDIDRCACGHDHTASFMPFLASRLRPPLLR